MLDKVHNYRPENHRGPKQGLRYRGAAARHNGAVCWVTTPCARRRSSIVLGLIWEIYALILNNDLLGADARCSAGARLQLVCSAESCSQRSGTRSSSTPRLYRRTLPRDDPNHRRQRDAHRGRPARNVDGAVQSLAVDRAVATCDGVVRPWRSQHRIRSYPCRTLVGGPQHVYRLPSCEPDMAHGRPELRLVEPAARAAHPHPRRISEHSGRTKDRVGILLAHSDRRGTRVRQ